ncbi:MAG: hypothetical protein H7A50_09920 [Akkermansiaceae bacterium]|nr:hypothetical protein [Akkermansiaceae bacterium]
MQHLESVEDILGRLMPPALSQSCEEEIGELLEEFAAESVVPLSAARTSSPVFRWWAGGIAAAGAAAAFVIPALSGTGGQVVSADPPPRADVVLVSESRRVESVWDEGLQDIGDGAAMRATRLSLVEESTLFDEETGLEVRISEPREEVMLMPVSAF